MSPSCFITFAWVLCNGSCKGSKGTLRHSELFQARSVPQLLEMFFLAVWRSFPALKSTWVFSSHSELCVLTSSVSVSLFQIFLGEFSASFCSCFFILFCINNTGRAWRGRGEGSFKSAGVFPNRFIIINLSMLFPSLKASWFIITMKKKGTLCSVTREFVSVKAAAFCSKFHI